MPTPTRSANIAPHSMFMTSELANAIADKYIRANRDVTREDVEVTYTEPPDEELSEQFFADLSSLRRLVFSSRYGWLTRPNWGAAITTESVGAAVTAYLTTNGINETMRYLPWYLLRDANGNRTTQRQTLADSRGVGFSSLAFQLLDILSRHGVSVANAEPYIGASHLGNDTAISSTLELMATALRQEPYQYRGITEYSRIVPSHRVALVLRSVPEFSSQRAVEELFGLNAANLPRGLTLSDADVGKVFFWYNHSAFRFSPPGQDGGTHQLRVAHPAMHGRAHQTEPIFGDTQSAPAVVGYNAIALATSLRYWRLATAEEIGNAVRAPALLNSWYYLPQSGGISMDDFVHSLGIHNMWSNALRSGISLLPALSTTRDDTTVPPPVPERSEPSPTIRSDVAPATVAGFDIPAPATARPTLRINSLTGAARRSTVTPIASPATAQYTAVFNSQPYPTGPSDPLR